MSIEQRSTHVDEKNWFIVMFDLILRGGPIMLILLACSITGVYIVIQKLLFFKAHFRDRKKSFF